MMLLSLLWGTGQKSVLFRLPDRADSGCSKKAAVLTHRYREGRSLVFSLAGFLLGRSHREGLVSPSFLRNHLQRGTVHDQKAPA